MTELSTKPSKHPRIAYVVNGLGFAWGVSLGGSDKRVLEIGRRLNKKKAAVLVLTTTTGRTPLERQGLDVEYYVVSPPFSGYAVVERTSVGRMLSYF